MYGRKCSLLATFLFLFMLLLFQLPNVKGLSAQITNKRNTNDYPTVAYPGQKFIVTVRWTQDFTTSNGGTDLWLYGLPGNNPPLTFQEHRDLGSLAPGSYSATFYEDIPPTTTRVVIILFAGVCSTNPSPDCASDSYPWDVTVAQVQSTTTITNTIIVTQTSTVFENRWTTVTLGLGPQTVTRTVITDVNVQGAITETVVTTVTGGTFTSTIYSPTTTVTVTAAQIISDPFTILSFLMLGLFLAPPFRRRRLSQLREAKTLLKWLVGKIRSHALHRMIVAASLIAVSFVSILGAVEPGYASVVTVTNTGTATQNTTLTNWLTSTVYVGSVATVTSTLTRINTALNTVSMTVTRIVGGGTTTVYLPTTTYTTVKTGFSL